MIREVLGKVSIDTSLASWSAKHLQAFSLGTGSFGIALAVFVARRLRLLLYWPRVAGRETGDG